MGLENRLGAIPRGFESLILRQFGQMRTLPDAFSLGRRLRLFFGWKISSEIQHFKMKGVQALISKQFYGGAD